MTVSAWVVGGSGLLGSSLVSRLEQVDTEHIYASRIDWSSPQASLEDLETGLKVWLTTRQAERFELYWAAGAAVVASGSEATQKEELVFSRFLNLLQHELERSPVKVALFLASSAGGIYAGGSGAPFLESSPSLPTTAYGEAKQAMEQRLIELASVVEMDVFVGRISNLYGPGQRIDKAQGFISHLCKSMVTRVPMSVYVPLDTMRDFIHSDDAAHVIVTGMRQLGTAVAQTVVKNICSGRSTTLGYVLHDAKLAFKRAPSIVVAPTRQAIGQVLDLRISSEVWTELDTIPRRSLLVGLSQTRASIERQAFSKGHLFE